MTDAPRGYDDLIRLAEQTGRSRASLAVLSPNRDPFFAGTAWRRARAVWFVKLLERLKIGRKVNVRRIHYRIISQRIAVKLPNGRRYINTKACQGELEAASLDARYLGLVSGVTFTDERNAEPIIYLPSDEARPGWFSVIGAGRPDVEVPLLPTLWLNKPTIRQRFHVEMWAEKTTANDVLGPIAMGCGVNLITGKGELSETACRNVIERARASKLPVRILYFSDFDPGGLSMPVAVARKIDFLRLDRFPDLDLQLRPLVLTLEQCQHYDLPRTPIKEGEKRRDAFERRYGRGATELDALEALHPGELRRITLAEVMRYFDPDLGERITEAASDFKRRADEIDREVDFEFADEVVALQDKYEALADETGELFDRIGDRKRERARDAGLYAREIKWPEPRPGDEDPDPLYSSRRGYVEQVDRFKRHQGKDDEG